MHGSVLISLISTEVRSSHICTCIPGPSWLQSMIFHPSQRSARLPPPNKASLVKLETNLAGTTSANLTWRLHKFNGVIPTFWNPPYTSPSSRLIICINTFITTVTMSIRSIPNIARYATTSAAPKPKVLVVGAGTSLFPIFLPSSIRCASAKSRESRKASRVKADFAGSGGLAVANQIYNAFKAQGQTLNPGDVSIVDVRHPSTLSYPYVTMEG